MSWGSGGWSKPDTPALPPQAEGPENFQLVEVLMGSRQGERVACSRCPDQSAPSALGRWGSYLKRWHGAQC